MTKSHILTHIQLDNVILNNIMHFKLAFKGIVLFKKDSIRAFIDFRQHLQVQLKLWSQSKYYYVLTWVDVFCSKYLRSTCSDLYITP